MLRKEIYQGQAKLKEDISALFLEAFPEDERPPLWVFLRSLEKKEVTMLCFYDENAFIGFTYLAVYQDVCGLFFFAVNKKYRHQGYGGQILEIIKKDYQNYVIMLAYEEVDEKYPNYVERLNRKEFYRHHDFIDNKIKTNEYGVIYETAYIGSHQVSFSSYLEIFKIVFGKNQGHNVVEA